MSADSAARCTVPSGGRHKFVTHSLPIKFVSGLVQDGAWRVRLSDGTVQGGWVYDDTGYDIANCAAAHSWGLNEVHPLLFTVESVGSAKPSDVRVALKNKKTPIRKRVPLIDFLRLNPDAAPGELKLNIAESGAVLDQWGLLLAKINAQRAAHYGAAASGAAASRVIRVLSADEQREAARCALTAGQKTKNVLGFAATSVALTPLTWLPVIGHLAAALTPVPLDWMLRYATKTPYYMGYQHEKAGATPTDGVFTWSLLSYPNGTNSLRILVHGGDAVQAAWEPSAGPVFTGLQLRDGQLYVWVIRGDTGERLEQGVHWLDGVEYISCGPRPYQAFYEVTVVDGAPTDCALRNMHSTGATGVHSVDYAAAAAAAARDGVCPDGAVRGGDAACDGRHRLSSVLAAAAPERVMAKNRLERAAS